MQISESIKYVGVDDTKLDLFEGQFILPAGMAYNSYLIMDEKIAVMDSVDGHFGDEWISNLKAALDGKKPDYLVVQHMEMDHSANIKRFTEEFPEAKIVASKMAFIIMKNLFETDFPDKQIVVTDGSKLELGKHVLNFVTAPNVHWPEVIMTYESTEKVLFSADAFGKFGTFEYDDPEGWECEARRYYFGIVGKFGESVQALLKKIASFEISTICPLHGPVLNENISHYINLYDIWSSYRVETDGVFIAYTSVYGNTKKAAEKLAELLKAKGCPKVSIADLAREDMAECVEDAFRYGKIVLATTTYNGDIFPFMKDFIHHLKDKNYQNRKIGLIENGSWGPQAAKVMTSMFEGSKDITFCENKVTIKTAVKADTLAQLEKLADELAK
ncbi:MAG: MBL fold metallo-hydrolase [Treponemataceae bacterium]|nr:MBL fold metallo-hydrolase [Treponemataceae bacterium]